MSHRNKNNNNNSNRNYKKKQQQQQQQPQQKLEEPQKQQQQKEDEALQQQAIRDLGLLTPTGINIPPAPKNAGLRPNGSLQGLTSPSPRAPAPINSGCDEKKEEHSDGEPNVDGEGEDEGGSTCDKEEEKQGEQEGANVGVTAEEEEAAPKLDDEASVGDSAETPGEKGAEKAEIPSGGVSTVEGSPDSAGKSGRKKRRLIQPEEKQPSEFYVWIRSWCGCVHY